MIDDDVAATLQPHFGLQCLVNLILQTKLLEQRSLFAVKLDPPNYCWLEAVGKAQNALVLLLGINPNRGKVRRDLVAQNTFDHVQVVINQRRRLAVFSARANFVPQAFQETDVGPKLLFVRALSGGTHDESAVTVFTLALDDSLQPQALFVGSDLTRDASVIHGRHVHQKTSRQGDMAGDARALLADRLFGDLYQDFLAFLQQVGDQRQVLRLSAAETAATSSTPAETAAAPVAFRWLPAGTLSVSCGCGGRANLGAGLQSADGFGIE